MARAAAIILKNDNVALIQRQRDGVVYYLFPGGQVEPGESLTETVIREVKEELGLHIAVRRLIAEVTFQGQIQSYFLAEILDGQFGTGMGTEMLGLSSPEAGTYTPVWRAVSSLLGQAVYPQGVCELIVQAMGNAWPEETVSLQDEGQG